MENIEQIIQQETETLLDKMGVVSTVTITKEEDTYVIHIAMPEDGTPAQLIGYHAEGLNALQRILSIIIYQSAGDKVHILVDINDYRSSQKERLESIARSIADRVMLDKQPSVLRHFNPYERKIIHSFISSEYPELTTTSEGEGFLRELVVSYNDTVSSI